MRTVFEVGANEGHDVAEYLKDTNTRVFAFEAAPYLFLQMIERFKDEQRLFPFNMAVDIENGFKKFNIAANDGCHSLHNFTHNITEIWEGHDDLHFVKSYENILCMRLDSFMDIYNIDKIDYLEIDTQGNDLNVLKGLGDRIYDVKEGHCEASYEFSLYQVESGWEHIKQWLESKDFKVTVKPHFDHNVEVDLHFIR
jgi:FkbM family methyltransferase